MKTLILISIIIITTVSIAIACNNPLDMDCYNDCFMNKGYGSAYCERMCRGCY